MKRESAGLVISISTDWLYPPYLCKEIAEALSANDIDVRHCEIKSNYMMLFSWNPDR